MCRRRHVLLLEDTWASGAHGQSVATALVAGAGSGNPSRHGLALARLGQNERAEFYRQHRSPTIQSRHKALDRVANAPARTANPLRAKKGVRIEEANGGIKAAIFGLQGYQSNVSPFAPRWPMPLPGSEHRVWRICVFSTNESDRANQIDQWDPTVRLRITRKTSQAASRGRRNGLTLRLNDLR